MVGIVDAQNDPKAESDLATFRARYGLPACTTANGCFRKVNQFGKPAPLPAGDEGWGVGDLARPGRGVIGLPGLPHPAGRGPHRLGCSDLGTGVNTAVRLGAVVVSNSYGTTEFGGMAAYGRKYYLHPNVPIVDSSGDEWFGPASFPAVLGNVIGVGVAPP